MNAPRGWHRIKSRYRYRVVAGVLVVALPITILLGLLLTRSAASSLSESVHNSSESVARAVTLRLEDWISERHENMSTIAAQASGRLTDPITRALLTRIDKTYGDFEVIEVTDAAGQVVSTSRPNAAFEIAERPWFRSVLAGQAVITDMTNEDGDVRWIVAAPIVGRDGKPEGVVAGDLDETLLAEILNPELENQKGAEATAVDHDHRLLYDTSMGHLANPAAMLALGTLSTKVENRAVDTALSGQAGTAGFKDVQRRSAIGGFDALDDPHWAILVSRPKSIVLAPVAHQRTTAMWLILAGAVIATLFALWFARREARSLRALADESTNASTEVNASAAQLSASSEELAATTRSFLYMPITPTSNASPRWASGCASASRRNRSTSAADSAATSR